MYNEKKPTELHISLTNFPKTYSSDFKKDYKIITI